MLPTWLVAIYHALPDVTFERILSGLDVAVSGALLFVGWKALGQLKIAETALSAAKTDLSTRVQREAAKETAQQLLAWAGPVLEKLKDAHDGLESVGINVDGNKTKMEHYDEDELAAAPEATRNHAKAFTEAMRKDPKLYALLVDTCNLVEASAMNFYTGVADETIAFEPLSQTFVWSVDRNFPVYCMHRKRRNTVNYYPYTMKLYRLWSQRLAQGGLDAQHKTISEARAKAAKDGAPRRPLGA